MATPIVLAAEPLEDGCVAPSAPQPLAEAPVHNVSRPPSPQVSRGLERFAQTLVLAVLFAVPALICLHVARPSDPDVWWHLRAGEWMLQHHAVPHVDSFSRELAGTPWLAYSWMFETLLAKLFGWFGPVGMVAYSVGMVVAITLAMYHLVRRLQADFTLSILLTFASMYCMGHLFTPRPWLFTILLFVLEIDILMHARRTGKLRELAWLPLLFALWANVHIQFVDGLLLLALALFEAAIARWSTVVQTRAKPAWLAFALLASLLATLANPYGWHIYRVAYDLATQGGALNSISELQSIPFRDLADFVVLLIALASAAALAWHRRLVSFEGFLLLLAVILSFRSQRDVWVMATAGAAILASTLVSRRKPEPPQPAPVVTLSALTATLVIFAGFRVLHVNNEQLRLQLANIFPVRAVEAVQQKNYSGPLYNDFNWGGYLIWSLRMPVSVDGRQNLYGDKRLDRSAATWAAAPDWASDTQLTSAGLIIGPVGAPLTQILRADPRFRLTYQDNVAAVFAAVR